MSYSATDKGKCRSIPGYGEINEDTLRRMPMELVAQLIDQGLIAADGKTPIRDDDEDTES